VNGNPEVTGRATPGLLPSPQVPRVPSGDPPDGGKQLLEKLGPEGFAKWMFDQEKLLVTDTTMRDAHQSLLATRLRSHDILAAAPWYAHAFSNLLSLESWGGATFDVAMRFLNEDPWERLARLCERTPNLLQQMLLRGANGVGYKNYPDNVVRFFVQQSAAAGIDLFRVFDSLNWAENMRVAMDAVLEAGKLCEAAICYTGDLSAPDPGKYDLKYYVGLARELEKAGAHILAIKDMGGLCKPAAARLLVATLKQETGLPIHFHTHDTGGVAVSSVLAAAEAGVDAVDLAVDSMAGFTSQPSMGAVVASLSGGARDPGIAMENVHAASHYWEEVRRHYLAFESDIRAGSSDVFEHGMPGGQYTNLREQARSMGLEKHWPEVTKAYAEVNRMFGDIVKVTPTSKVVGDLALSMVAGGLTAEDVENPDKDIAFPESVIELFSGNIGQPVGGFPEALQKKILKGGKPLTARPGSIMEPADMTAERAKAEKKARRHIGDRELASWLMYPAVFADYARHRRKYSDTSVIPTDVYFYGLAAGQEVGVDIEQGKTLFIRWQATGELDDDGNHTVFFELNGQPRTVKVRDRALAAAGHGHRKADEGDPGQIGAPMPGLIVSVSVKAGDDVAAGDRLFVIEAMKMETAVYTDVAGRVTEVVAAPGSRVEPHDLVIVLAA
jgi:pyruvate carboxylase